MINLIALALGLLHFFIPLGYYYYIRRYVDDSWDLEVNSGYRPNVSVIIPTYLEVNLIEEKLNNILSQDYPKEKMEILIVDSASEDGTVKRVRKWMEGHDGFNIRVMEEAVRRGKAYALNQGLKWLDGSSRTVVITDVDCFWQKDALRETLKYFADRSVGAVTCTKIPKVASSSGSVETTEKNYRRYYATVRIAESKIHSTPIFHGELAAFRRDVLEGIGGFPLDIGADDSHSAMLVALEGYRSICIPEVRVTELVPQDFKGYFVWRVRRAQHLIQHFAGLVKRKKKPRSLAGIVWMESFLHIFNPWLLLMSIIMFTVSLAVEGLSFLNMTILGVILSILVLPWSRRSFLTWITKQITLAYAQIRNVVVGRELVWPKVNK